MVDKGRCIVYPVRDLSPHATFEQINPLSSARGDPYERRYYLLRGHVKRGKGWKQIELDA